MYLRSRPIAIYYLYGSISIASIVLQMLFDGRIQSVGLNRSRESDGAKDRFPNGAFQISTSAAGTLTFALRTHNSR